MGTFTFAAHSTFATEQEDSLTKLAFLQPFPGTVRVASGGQPPLPPAGCPLRASSWPNIEPSAGASAAQRPGRHPGGNRNMFFL